MQLQTEQGAESDTPTSLVELEQVRMLFHHMSTSISGTVFGATLIVLMMWSVVAHELLLTWLAAMWVNQGIRLRFYLRFRQSGLGSDNVHRCTVVWMIGTAVSALLWSSANILFFVSDSPLHQALLLTSTFAIVSVAVPLVASHLPSLYIFAGPIMASAIARNAWEGDNAHALLAGISLAALLGVISVGRRYNRLLAASHRARFEKELLASQLSRQNSELQSARHQAEQASIAKSRFLAAASHDLRQPLHALSLFAGALSNERSPDKIGIISQHIQTSVSALETLFNSLLDISKLDAGVVKHHVTDFGAQEIFDRIQNDFEPLASLKHLRLTVRPTAAVLRTDCVLLEQMLRNLVANAIRYTESGGLLLACRRRGRRWRLEVRDSGVGIPADQHQRVFEEFYQIGNRERDRQKGLGLGLAIVARLSRLLGCPIELLSRPGHGTTVAVTVPEGRLRRRAPIQPHIGTAALGGLRILIVDDEAEVRSAMQAVMRTWGCDTVCAESLLDGVAKMKAAEWVPDLAISDYRLKDDQDGIEVLNWLREQYGADLPCLLLTGDIEAERLKAVRESGYPLLHKPISPAKLQGIIERLTRRVEEAT